MWATFIAELKHIFKKNKFRPWEWLFICIVPFLYGFLYMNAYWSPFQKTDKLRIGIVNLDKEDSGYSKASEGYLKDIVASGKKGLNVGKHNYKININDVSEIYSDNNWTKESVEKEISNNKYDGIIVINKGYSKIKKIVQGQIINSISKIIANDDISKIIKEINTNLKILKGTPLVSFYNSAKNSYLGNEMTNFGSGLSAFNLNTIMPSDSEISSKTGLQIKSIEKIKKIISQFFTDNSIIDKSNSIGSNIDTYGFGLAPYFMCIALWAGALIMTFLFKNERHIKTKNTFKHYFGKSLIWVFTGWIQAIILCTAISLQGVHLNGDIINNWQLYLIGIFISTIFTLTVQGIFYMFRYGDLGEFVIVLLLVMQLVSSSGTFPVLVQSKIFQWLNPIVPFTYGIRAIRELMYEPNINIFMKNLGILLIFPAIFINLSLIVNIRHDIKTSFLTTKGKKNYKSLEMELDDF